MRSVIRTALSLPMIAVLVMSSQAYAKDFEFGEFNFSLKNRLSVGGAWALEDPEEDLIAKLNIEGQQNLCAADDCLSFTGDPGPNQRLVDARGAFNGQIQDDNRLNYSKNEPIAAVARIDTKLTGFWRNWSMKLRVIGTFDEANHDFDERHTNTTYQAVRVKRPSEVEEAIGYGFDILDASIATELEIGGRVFFWSLGNQSVRWGESTLIALGSLNEINPPNAARLRIPGGQIKEVFTPVPLIVVGTDLNETMALEAFYQFGWEAAVPDPGGSFFGTLDALERDNGNAEISLGQFPEDPNALHRIPGDAALITDTAISVPVQTGVSEPEDGGQFGLRFNWFVENLLGGTELSFYGMRYHSRLPYLSVTATDNSCLNRPLPAGLGAVVLPPGVDTSFVEAVATCGSFNGSIASDPVVGPLLTATTTALALAGLGTPAGPQEPLPIDTIGVFVDYPEDIDMYGMSFNTNIGDWSLAGEFVYRPNLPLQVQLADVLFAGLQPAFPRDDVLIPGLGATIPRARIAAPDYVETRYRGNTVQPGQLIRGYERMKVGQVSMTAIRIISGTNPIKADQIVFLLESGFTNVFDMPSLHELQFEGGSANRTHFSPGADGTGTTSGPDSRRLTPTYQREGHPDAFSWGYRIITQMEYNDLIYGFNFKPMMIWTHDIKGISPFPVQNFIEGAKSLTAGLTVEFSQSLSGLIQYQGYWGDKPYHLLQDKDNIAVSFAYNF